MAVMTERAPNTRTEHPGTARPNTEHRTGAEQDRRAAIAHHLARARTVVLTGVVLLPPALNAQNIVEWANSPNGLGLSWTWAWVAFTGLDAVAAVCVFETLIQTQKGRRAGAFAALVWLFAGASAWAGYRHGTQPGVGRDVKWFFPLMAVAGPLLLHLVLTRTRKDAQVDEGKRLEHTPASAFGWQRWVPGVGAFAETYCAWRVGRLEGVIKPADTIARYRALRPDAGRGGLRVLHALRVDDARTRDTDQVDTPNTEGPAAPSEGRPRTPNTRRPNTRANVRGRANTGQSGGDVDANLEQIKVSHPDWRTNTPSVRKIAFALGVSVSTGQAYQKRLIAEQANTTEQSDSDDAKERTA